MIINKQQHNECTPKIMTNITHRFLKRHTKETPGSWTISLHKIQCQTRPCDRRAFTNASQPAGTTFLAALRIQTANHISTCFLKTPFYLPWARAMQYLSDGAKVDSHQIMNSIILLTIYISSKNAGISPPLLFSLTIISSKNAGISPPL